MGSKRRTGRKDRKGRKGLTAKDARGRVGSGGRTGGRTKGGGAWLRAVILGTVIGPSPVGADPIDPLDWEPAELEEPTSGKQSGHAVQGTNFHVWDEDSREATDWAVELLDNGGKALEMARWRSMAARSAALPPLPTDDLEALLTARNGVSSSEIDITTLGCILCLLPSLDRTALVSAWATAPDEGTRRELARALSAPFEAVGVRGVLEHLQRDPDPEVRRLAREAAAIRRSVLV